MIRSMPVSYTHLKVSGVIERRLAESGIEGATIKRRVKSIYGIYRKPIMQNKSFDEIYDIYAAVSYTHLADIYLLDNISTITVSFDCSNLGTKTMNLPNTCVQVVNLQMCIRDSCSRVRCW